ncbi:hypothetical protein ANN_24236 [Periplaneta americana]|uniref:Uncharacterized protein n=1 Tax=Periplaneta americana TaxID=6978 RepID=A0ABQ8S395_PERAM|nr:hypothetical protein ANN_24236 [Periplaneta americana]
MAGLCEGGNEPSGSLKAVSVLVGDGEYSVQNHLIALDVSYVSVALDMVKANDNNSVKPSPTSETRKYKRPCSYILDSFSEFYKRVLQFYLKRVMKISSLAAKRVAPVEEANEA